MILDLWDYVAAGGEIENIRSIPMNQIVAVQIADMPADVSASELVEANRLLPGKTGKPDIGAALKILAEAGYEGPVTIKPAKKAADSRRRDPVARAAGLAMHLAFRSADLPGTQTPAILRAEREAQERSASLVSPSEETGAAARGRRKLALQGCAIRSTVFGVSGRRLPTLRRPGLWPRKKKKRPDPACGSGRSSFVTRKHGVSRTILRFYRLISIPTLIP